MDHPELVKKYLREPGVEIGAFKTPIPGIRPIYVDRFAEYAGAKTLADYYGDACDLPFRDSSLRYVASSHVLEHVANPLAALAEWYRVLEHGGIVYAVVPDRCCTFDSPRHVTNPAHMLEDYQRGTTQSDGTHIDDFVYGVDWRRFSPATPPSEEKAARDQLAQTYRGAVDAGREINIHFHVFESATGRALIEAGNRARIWPGRMDIVEVQERFPDSNPIGFLIVARVHKPLRQRLAALTRRKGLRPDARKF